MLADLRLFGHAPDLFRAEAAAEELRGRAEGDGTRAFRAQTSGEDLGRAEGRDGRLTDGRSLLKL